MNDVDCGEAVYYCKVLTCVQQHPDRQSKVQYIYIILLFQENQK